MVARLFFPAFAKHHAPGYHRYLAEVVEFSAKIADPTFRMKATIKHMEDFSNLCSGDATQQWAKSMRTGIAMTKAMDAGIKSFWESMFSGFAKAQQTYTETVAAPRKSSRLVLGRSADDHVLSVLFRNRALSESALKEIREEPQEACSEA